MTTGFRKIILLFHPLNKNPSVFGHLVPIYLTLEVLNLPPRGPRGGGGGVAPDPHRVGPGRVEDDEVHGDDDEVGDDEEDHGEDDVNGRGGGGQLEGLAVERGEERGRRGDQTEEGQE